jgi:hypothetical protein
VPFFGIGLLSQTNVRLPLTFLSHADIGNATVKIFIVTQLISVDYSFPQLVQRYVLLQRRLPRDPLSYDLAILFFYPVTV